MTAKGEQSPAEQKEAVCGTCGGRIRRVGVGINPGTLRGVLACENGHAIPAPVVPSDDERCECGLTHEGDCPECGARWMAHRTHAPKGKDFRSKVCPHSSHGFTPPAPPTPSQDAEGDGWRWGDGKATRLGEAVGIAQWRVSYKPGQRGYDFDTGTAYHNVPVEVESAIREPYEALVKAVGLFIRRATVEECFGCGAPIHHGAGHEAGCAVVSLYVALESLGDRKDG